MNAHPLPVGWPDPHAAYRAISGRDPRFDGRLFVGVLSTGIYCRPSCPARTPLPENCRFYPAAAAAVAAGFRACRRCRPDSLPGSRDWDSRGDLAARALRAIGDGAVDTDGVEGLATRLHVSPRHLHRVLVAEIGASPLQLARTRRAQLARMLLDQTELSMVDVAFAAGFASLRQFNDVMRTEFGAPPSTLRRDPATARGTGRSARGTADRTAVAGAVLTLRLRHLEPYDAASWFAHTAGRAIAGLERVEGTTAITKLLGAPGGPALVTVSFEGPGKILARLQLADLTDLAGVVTRLRRWLDLDCDPRLVDDALGADPVLAPLVAARPGLRIPGTTDPFELAVRAVLGQQVSVAGARTLAARLVALHGASWLDPHGADRAGLSLFPTAAVLASAGPDRLREIGLTGARAVTLARLAEAVAEGLPLTPDADRGAVRAGLLALPGIGPWTADYIALRALGDPDVFPAGDLVLRKALAELPGGAGRPVDIGAATASAAPWRPWRGYAAQHLWSAWSAWSVRTRPSG
ncbi:DNA-3-methyladenine glycosylase 2 family protein [Pengzhenrongella frigida]|uniref:DNA-3-methyladenine glycosylase II n=1 Tax=Pengzhenrongella frigida TaxID=1259133 RepID=A0A4Q5N0A7_9MICO|nr:DNA-3-methyladenine glycosylase 2 [Cellulomonas sp. HLT2-17]RYV51446.1 DNA-3-methyladenine glycosylase 2 family protein [Cellulomonas sp. HLT2-17]